MLQLDLSDEVLAYSSLNEPDIFLCKKQRDDFTKKYCSQTTDNVALEQKAFSLFHEINASMFEFNNFIFPDNSSDSPLLTEDKILLSARYLVQYVLGSFCEEEFLQNCRHSSGSSVGVNYFDTSPEAKFKSPISCTEGIDQWFKWYLTWDSRLKNTLTSREPISFKFVEGSKATTVPKDNTKVRMICVEPTLNMFFQQGIMSMIVSRLAKVGLSLESLQQTHKHLAQVSSITGLNATIDWSSASDCVSNSLVAWLLPRDWYYYADKFRSKKMLVNGTFVELNMFSTMGNATTFPIETLVFWSLAVASDYHRIKRCSLFIPDRDFNRVSVFGDDCIVPALSAQIFIDLGTKLGFRVNTQKTFLEGGFRESCGGDFLFGSDVRPFYLEGPTSLKRTGLIAWINIMLNRIINRSIRIWGPNKFIYFMQNTLSYLFSLYRTFKLELYIVPTYYPEDSGVKIGYDLGRFRRNYKLRPILPIIRTDRHGTRTFPYLSYKYRAKREVWSELRYCLKLKFPALSEVPLLFPVRRKGSYVVATGLSPAFHIV
jgi:hypothetical protein